MGVACIVILNLGNNQTVVLMFKGTFANRWRLYLTRIQTESRLDVEISVIIKEYYPSLIWDPQKPISVLSIVMYVA